jgi:hypothetical protein
MANTTTLWDLSPQPLPPADLKDSVFVTIWLFSCLLFSFALYVLLRNPDWWGRKRATWDEFLPILIGTVLHAL